MWSSAHVMIALLYFSHIGGRMEKGGREGGGEKA